MAFAANPLKKGVHEVTPSKRPYQFFLYTPDSFLPDGNPIFRSKIHTVTLGDAIEVQKLFKLLKRAVDTQIAHGVLVVDLRVSLLQSLLGKPYISKGTEERILIKALLLCCNE